MRWLINTGDGEIMAKYEENIIGNFEEVVTNLEKDINNSGVTMNLVDESNYKFKDTSVAVRVYDKYFMRNGNRASLSVTIVGHENNIFISAIGAGGGQGVIFNFSLGAEDDMVYVVEKSVEKIK
ncbi:DUF6054 family protein [Senegalia massiliensis]|jgi:hypothetical protein|uniref:DUF6054 family protein n=1 Tax=Senegalia massiliensis TaxID=1720316 RepID=UPI001F5F2BCD|nr:DUF6054 family protein [Senegalia massiliensis]